MKVRPVKLNEPALGNSTVDCPCAPSAVAALTDKVVRIFFIGRMIGTLSAVWRLLGSSALPGGNLTGDIGFGESGDDHTRQVGCGGEVRLK